MVVTATVCGLGAAPSRADGSDVRLSAPASVVAGKPCRVTVAVSAGVRGTALLQQRTGSRWRTVSTARLKRRSAALRCPTVSRAGLTRRFRALVRRVALLANPKLILDADGVADIRAGRIDPRIIAVLTTLSHTYTITVSTMCSDHPKLTSGGSISNHWFGRGMDIAAIDGVPVSPGNVRAREATDALSSFDPSYRPDEVGSPWVISGRATSPTPRARTTSTSRSSGRSTPPGRRPPDEAARRSAGHALRG